MSDPDTRPAGDGQTQRLLDPGVPNIQLIYILYLADAVAASHYTYLIRTFWMGLAYALLSMVLMMVGIGFLLMIALVVWLIVRCVKGLQWVSRGEPVPNPETWLF
eukprot:jgi/Tetstr1/463880/TSEL_008691.t1